MHPDLQKLTAFYRSVRANPPETFVRAEGVLRDPAFFSVAALQAHLSNPVIAPNLVTLMQRGQQIPLEKSCAYKTIQQKQVWFMDKRVLDESLRQGASVILEGLDILDPEINAFCAELDAGLPCALVNCVAFFSQQRNELYRGHIDTDDVLVVQISGEKYWSLHAKQPPRRVQLSEMTPEQMGPQVAELTLRAGDVMYVRSGIPHRCETRASHSLHLAFDLIDRAPNADEILRTAHASYDKASAAPYTPAAEVAKRLSAQLASPELAAAVTKRQEAIRLEARAFRDRMGATRVRALDKFLQPQPSEEKQGA